MWIEQILNTSYRDGSTLAKDCGARLALDSPPLGKGSDEPSRISNYRRLFPFM